MSTDKIHRIIRDIPDKPGVYQFFSQAGSVIYVGKAKSLRKRVSSYFNRESAHDAKTAVLVKKISDLRFIVVDTEFDALLLENNLIKKYQPRYNVLLKDDKTFPWICIRNERFPRVFSTRRVVRDGSKYFGPYASGKMLHTLMDLITQLFPLRNCNLILSKENIEKKKFKVCLEYHIGNCLGPCAGLQSEEDYNNSIQQAREILKGNTGMVLSRLKKMMGDYASAFEFEKAQLVKEKIEVLEKYRSRSTVVSPSVHNVDVFSLVTGEQYAYVNFFRVVDGAIVLSHTLELKKKLDESPRELLVLAIGELRQRFPGDVPEAIVPLDPELDIPGMIFTVPKIGDKKHLLDLSEKNVRYYMRERALRNERTFPGNRSGKILREMKADLRLGSIPVHIECFDNSNIQGAFPVAAMSVFRNGKPSKKDYRHFNIRSVSGPDDFASMDEVISRRYRRMLEEGKDLPQLIIIDGGKGQLNAALSALSALGIERNTGIIGIAKRLEEIFLPGDPVPLYLDKRSSTLKVIQQLRDEAHRFGITHHRNRRSKETIKTSLTDIKGIGPATAALMLRHFRSVEAVLSAPAEELEKIAGKKKAEIVLASAREKREKKVSAR